MLLLRPRSTHRTRLPSSTRPTPLPFIAVAAAGFFGAISVTRLFDDRAEAAPLERAAASDVEAPAGQALDAPRAPELGLLARASEGKLIAGYGEGTAVLTRERALEEKLDQVLAAGQPPYAATVLLEAQTGRVIAIAEYSTRGSADGLATQPMAPAASIFKIVTTAALLEEGVRPAANVCTHGGRTRMQPALLVDNQRRDHQCTTFGDVLSHSQNVAMAKLALKHLDPERLRNEAHAWGFERPLALDVRLSKAWKHQASPVPIPEDPFGFANTAAGFGDVRISALHGAVIASIVANDGVLVPPRFIESVDGENLLAPDPQKPTRVVSTSVARALKSMMADTVSEGTARRVFSMSPRLSVSAGGKTGSLADYDTGLDTSWFVGFAPALHPEVIVASVVVNTPKWRVKAPFVAKEALRAYFKAHPPTQRAAMIARR